MGNVYAVTDVDFEAAVAADSGPVLVDFYTTWCPPCKALAPILDAVARGFAERLCVVKVDVDLAPHAATRHGVTTAPTLVLFLNGEEIDRKIGAPSRPVLEQWLARHVS